MARTNSRNRVRTRKSSHRTHQSSKLASSSVLQAPSPAARTKPSPNSDSLPQSLASRIGAIASKKQLQQLYRRRPKQSYQHAAVRAKRTQWANIARQTAAIVLGDGKYVETRRCPVPTLSLSPSSNADLDIPSQSETTSTWHLVHDISREIRASSQGTLVYPVASLDDWATSLPARASTARVEFTKRSPLTVARRRYIHRPTAPVGVLSSTSPRRPGGSYLSGASEPDSIICRSSSLIAALTSEPAKPFYASFKHHIRQHPSDFFYLSTLAYTPSVIGFRRDDEDRFIFNDPDFSPEMDAIPADPTTRSLELPPAVNGQNRKAMGEYVAPYLMNVVSAVPVNVHACRSVTRSTTQSNATHTSSETSDLGQDLRVKVRQIMKDRMGRILRLFELQGNRTVVLGTFGVNDGFDVEDCARAWAELLVCHGEEEVGNGRFRDVFEEVVLTVPGRLYGAFKKAWEMRVFEDDFVRDLPPDADDEDDADMEEVLI